MPGGSAVRQPILDHQTHGQGNDALGVVAAWGSQTGQIDAEMASAAAAVVPGVDHLQNPRAVTQHTAEVVQAALGEAVPITGATATRARPAAMVPRPLAEQGLRQVFDTGDAFRAIRDVRSRPRSHDRLLRLATGSNPGKPITVMKSRNPHFPCYSLKKHGLKGFDFAKLWPHDGE